MTPTFSVIVPAHNAARTIRSTLESVVRQSRSDLEVIVVDDGSSDETSDRVTGLKDERVVLLRQPQAGVSAARNRGLEEARGRFVCPLDADDLLLPRFLETMGAALEGAPAAGFAYTDAWTLDDRTGRIRRASAKAYQRPPQEPPHDPLEFFRLLLERNFVYGCTLVRRAVLDEVGGYATELRTGEDYELWLRIVSRGYGAVLVPGRHAVYREGQPASSSSNAVQIYRDNRRLLEIVASTYSIDDALRRRALERAEEERRQEQAAREGAPRVYAALRPLLRARRRLLRPFRWPRTRPPEVEALLAETGGWPV